MQDIACPFANCQYKTTDEGVQLASTILTIHSLVYSLSTQQPLTSAILEKFAGYIFTRWDK